MSTVAYPSEFPADSISFVVKVFRGQETPDKAALAHHGWNVQGYLQKIVLGEPNTEAILGPLSIDGETLALGLETLDPSRPQAILGGGLTKKLMLAAVIKLIELALKTDLPVSLEELIKSLLGGASDG